MSDPEKKHRTESRIKRDGSHLEQAEERAAKIWRDGVRDSDDARERARERKRARESESE
jgi:hypothetical protein